LCWYSRGSPQGIHLCSFDPSHIIFCESPLSCRNTRTKAWRWLQK
jgi:hypothetical protein